MKNASMEKTDEASGGDGRMGGKEWQHDWMDVKEVWCRDRRATASGSML